MRKKLFLFIVVLISQMSHSQRFYMLDDDKTYIDSLTAIIKTTKSDSLKCINSFKLADLYRKSKKTELSNQYLSDATKIAPKFKFLNDVAVYYNASSYLGKGDIEGYGNQLKLANEKLKKYRLQEAYVLRVTIMTNLSIIQQIKNNEKETMRILVDEAMPLAKKSGDLELIGNLYKSLAIIFMNNLERKKADGYLKQSIEYIEKAKKTSHRYQEIKVETYIINVENLCELERFPEAKISLDKAYEILKDYPNSNLNASFYFVQGLYFYKTKQFEKSIQSYDKGIANSDFHQDLFLSNRLKFAKYLPLKSLNRFEEVKDLLLELVGNDNETNFTQDQKNFNKELALAFEKLGDIKNAYKYSKKYITINDSLNEKGFREKILTLEAKFNKAEDEKMIAQLEAQREKDLLIAKNNKLYYGLLGSISFILLLIVILLWINSKNQKKIALEHAKNYKQNLTSLKNQKEIEVMQAMIKGEEVERKRIARDLHDGVGSMLSSLKMRFSKINNSPEVINPNEIENINILLANSIVELRQVSYNLIPESLLKLGLEHALTDLCHILETEKVNIDLQANNIKNDIPETTQITIYRIIQELINNALKHSNCSEILLDCSQNKDLFFITIEDNGKGFDTTMINDFHGLGLKSLKNRVESLSGKIEIDSSPDKGTVFNIELSI